MAEVTHNPNYSDFDDLVFSKRNRSYGAYAIRNAYLKYILIAQGIAILVIVLVLLIPYISAFIKGLRQKEEVKMQKNTEVTLVNPPPIDETEPEPPPPAETAPPPTVESVKFTVPIVTTEEVQEVTTTEDLQVSNPGSVTQEGVEGFIGPPGDDGSGELIGETQKEEIFTVVEKMPEFPGGEKALMDFLAKNIRYPETAKDLGIQGTVYISFIVDTYGNITNVEVLRGIGGGCDEEAARVVGKMPRWSPGKQGGRPVKVQYRLPIRFALNG